ncbi:MAG: ankyrin repeat domain-containing protein [Parasulfuritortus sp.]|jgi:ankyrin repeat protein|nr:ankyrin repeat domain-containing protein [Parasulfuritortus sp.]
MSAELYAAALAGDAHVVSQLLAAGANPDWANEDGATALMAAAHNGHLDAVQTLLDAGANANAADSNGWTALFKSVYNHELDTGFAPIAKALIDAGANVNATIHFGITPLMLAAGGGEGAVCEVLLEAGADPKAVNEAGRTALQMAKERHWVDVINLLHDATGFVPETEGACSTTGRHGPSDAAVVNFMPRRPH